MLFHRDKLGGLTDAGRLCSFWALLNRLGTNYKIHSIDIDMVLLVRLLNSGGFRVAGSVFGPVHERLSWGVTVRAGRRQLVLDRGHLATGRAAPDQLRLAERVAGAGVFDAERLDAPAGRQEDPLLLDSPDDAHFVPVLGKQWVSGYDVDGLVELLRTAPAP